MKNKPIRHRNHIIETKSKKYLESQIPDEWIIDEPKHDYGIDFNIGIVSQHKVTGHNFSIQLKGKERDENKEFVSVNLKKSTLNYYHVRLEPILLVIFIVAEEEGYWSWIDTNSIDLKKDQKKFKLKISRNNKLSEIIWSKVSLKVNQIFSLKFLLEKYPEINLSNLEESEKKAWKLVVVEEYNQAIVEFIELLRRENRTSWLIGLTVCYYELFRYDEALVTINKALAINDTSQLQFLKGSILAESGKQKREKGRIIMAKNIYEEHLTEEVTEASHNYNYANILTDLGEYEKAKEHYLITLEHKPNFAQAWKNLGQVYFYLEMHDKEIECYDKALVIDPKLPQALMSKGITLVSVFDKAKEGLNLMLESLKYEENLAISFPRGYAWIAEAYKKIGNILEAYNWINDGLNQQPQEVNLLGWASHFYANHWDYNDEIKNAAKSFFHFRTKLYSNDFESLYHYSKILFEETRDAKLIFQNVVNSTNILKHVELDELEEIGVDFINNLDILQNLDDYNSFRNKYRLDYYSDFIKVNDNEILVKLFSILDFIFGSVFSKALNAYKSSIIEGKNNHEKIIANIIFLNVKQIFPRIGVFLITKEKEEIEGLVNEIADIVTSFPTIGVIECGSQLGYIAGMLDLNKKKIEKELAELDNSELFSDLAIDTMSYINKKTNLLKEE